MAVNYSDKAKDIYYNVIPDNYNPIIPYFDCWVLVEQLTMPKFTSQILLLFSKVLHILENLLLKNFTGLKVVS